MEQEKAQKAYDEVLGAISKYGDLLAFDYKKLETEAKHHLFGLELKEKYGLNIDPKEVYSSEWYTCKEHVSVGWFGEKHRRTVSWSDDGKQPEDELMVYINFPTGAYIFGGSWGDDDYPVELFQEFFQELKSYNPKYVDSHNSSLYFPIETASAVFNSFSEIKAKYHEKNKIDSKKRKIAKLEKEIEKLS